MRAKLSILLLLTLATAATASEALAPRLTHLKLKAADWRTLGDRGVVVRELPAAGSKEMAGFGAVIVDAPSRALVESYRTLSMLKQSGAVIACGRFGPEPSLTDLAGLTVSDRDLLALSRSRPNDSGVKLSAPEIARIQAAVGPSPSYTQQLRARLTAEYKKILLEKVRAYAAHGEAALGAYADREEAVSVQEAFAGMLRQQAAAAGHGGQFYTQLATYPTGPARHPESFIYWAVQKFGQLKPVINLVHVFIYDDGGRTLIASKQIYASHYTEAGLGVVELIPLTDGVGRARTIAAYTIRLQVDTFGGALGYAMKRMALPRLLEGLKQGLHGLRLHVEAGQSVASLNPTPSRVAGAH